MYGREIDGEPATFGTTGYTLKSVFVLYDRRTESIWYPMSDDGLTATSGTRRGATIPFLDKPDVMPFARWREKHPDSVVLLPPRGAEIVDRHATRGGDPVQPEGSPALMRDAAGKIIGIRLSPTSQPTPMR